MTSGRSRPRPSCSAARPCRRPGSPPGSPATPSWHTRQGPDIGGVTLWADLEPRTAGTGALRLIPGSHLPGFERQLCEYRAAEPAASGFGHWEWPHVVVETEPGDVVAFHAHLLNRAQGGAPRLTWTIDYLPWPGLGRPDQLEVVRDLVVDAGEFDHEDYDRERWPVWRDWAAGAAQIPSRAIALERLRLLRVLTATADRAATRARSARDADRARSGLSGTAGPVVPITTSWCSAVPMSQTGRAVSSRG